MGAPKFGGGHDGGAEASLSRNCRRGAYTQTHPKAREMERNERAELERVRCHAVIEDAPDDGRLRREGYGCRQPIAACAPIT